MTKYTLDTSVAQQSADRTAVAPDHQPAAPALMAGLGRAVEKDRAVLPRLTNGRLARAGNALRQWQHSHGNQYVRRLVVQTKMVLGAVNDPYEQEADRVARQVVQRSGGSAIAVPRGRMAAGGTAVTPEIEAAIHSARNGGRPLRSPIQTGMSQALGADFSNVRIHTDHQADQLNQSLQSRAFTTGQDVFFRRGAYHPTSTNGQQLLAHELTHVAQQNGDEVRQRDSRTARTAPVVQRKVVKSHFSPEEDVKTILGVLEDEGLTDVYSIPENIKLRKNSQELDRAKEASAKIEESNKSGRGKATGDYKDVGALGNWERLAVSHIIEQKSIDTGHLIADEFFDTKQKAAAYGANNLAPQNADFNEDAYRRLIEERIPDNLGKNKQVKLAVKLAYNPDSYEIEVSDLVARGALVVEDEQESDDVISDGTKLEIPARLPTSWTAEVNLISKKKKEKIIGPDSGTLKKFKSHQGKRTRFTTKERYAFEPSPGGKQEFGFNFKQQIPYTDPGATLSLAKVAFDPGSSRATPRQLDKANESWRFGRRLRMLQEITKSKDKIIQSDAKKRKRVESVHVEMNQNLLSAKPKKLKAWKEELQATAKKHKLAAADTKKLLRAMDAVSDVESESENI